MATDNVKVDLPASRVHKGTAYGPGDDIEVPRAAAEAWGLTEATPAKKAEKKKSK